MGKLIAPKIWCTDNEKSSNDITLFSFLTNYVILVYALKMFTLNALVYETVNCLLQHQLTQ